MRKIAGTKMPKFSRNQSKQLTRSFDFIGVNYYVTIPVADDPNSLPADQRDWVGDASVKLIGDYFNFFIAS